jgi:hypothetical protein
MSEAVSIDAARTIKFALVAVKYSHNRDYWLVNAKRSLSEAIRHAAQ